MSTWVPSLRIAGQRRPVDWRNKPPSRTAYADWLRDSAPLQDSEPDSVVEPDAELLEAAE
jgi:hypothetical protein